MNNIYTDAKGNKLNLKTAFIRSQELNATAEGGLWSWELNKDGDIYIWFQEFAPAKVGA